jgi:hypothetical protein
MLPLPYKRKQNRSYTPSSAWNAPKVIGDVLYCIGSSGLVLTTMSAQPIITPCMRSGHHEMDYLSIPSAGDIVLLHEVSRGKRTQSGRLDRGLCGYAGAVRVVVPVVWFHFIIYHISSKMRGLSTNDIGGARQKKERKSVGRLEREKGESAEGVELRMILHFN